GSRLPGLVDACRTLDADVARGDLAAARTDWLSAHLAYESLGAAYTAFGSFDASINSRADGLPQGTATPGWTGFLAVEHALWSGRSAAQVRPLTQRLVADTSGLQKEWRSDEIDPGDMPLRTHEILENALQFQLTGDADYGSGTTLATTYANTQGTAELLATLAGQLAKLAPHVLSDARTQLATVQADLLAQRDSHGRWTPAASLTAAARSKLDADLGALLETLAQLPPTVDPRNGA
ncbi:MAG: EfeM/EfeO family lipoprotein, partial [Nocardioides sp.]|nr:EfeM/EfeO family lipoprotein [Nocardioides sp.]